MCTFKFLIQFRRWTLTVEAAYFQSSSARGPVWSKRMWIVACHVTLLQCIRHWSNFALSFHLVWWWTKKETLIWSRLTLYLLYVPGEACVTWQLIYSVEGELRVLHLEFHKYYRPMRTYMPLKYYQRKSLRICEF